MPIEGGKWAYLCTWMECTGTPAVLQTGCWLAINRQRGRKPCQRTIGESTFKAKGQTRMIVHSDRGGQYLSRKMKKVIKTFKLRQSMSRADDPYDNAWAESFRTGPPGGRMKAELDMPKGGYESIEKLKSFLFEYIDGYYNIRRLHSSLNYLNPVAFEAGYYRQTG